MNLRSMKLTDFRSYASADLAGLGRMNVIGGLNGAGKSTLLDALSVALTGTCRGAEAGRGLDELRRGGGRKWQIELAVEARPGEIERIRRSEGEGPRSATQDHVDGLLGMPGARARACLYSGELLRLPPKEAQKLILDLCDPGIEIPERVSDLIRRHLGTGFVSGHATIADLEQLYKAAFAARTDAGRDMKAHAAAAPAIPPGLESLEGGTVDHVIATRESVETRLRDLRKERGQAAYDLAQLAAQPEKLKAIVAERERRIPQLQEEFRALPEDPAGELMQLQDRLTAREAADEEARAAALKAHADLVSANQRAAAAQDRLNAIGSVKGAECPTCSQKVTPAHVKKVADALMREKQQAIDDMKEHELRLEQAGGDREDLRPTRDRIALLEGSGARRTALAAEIKKLDGELQEARADFHAANVRASEERDRLEGALEQLDARIKTGDAKLGALREYEGALKAAGEGAARADRAAAKHADLEWLVAELGPKGPLRAQAAGGTAQFQAAVNETLAAFGFTAEFGPLLDATGEAIVNGRPARLLSSSELMRFGIAFQVAVAAWSKLGIVAVDDWERFDGTSLRLAQRILAESGHQVFIFTRAMSEEDFRAKAGRGGASYFLAYKTTEGSVIEQLAGAAEVAA